MDAVDAALFPASMCAVTYTGKLSGEVTDPSGAVIAGAKVTLTDQATSVHCPRWSAEPSHGLTMQTRFTKALIWISPIVAKGKCEHF
jgi:hypothetical protein